VLDLRVLLHLISLQAVV